MAASATDETGFGKKCDGSKDELGCNVLSGRLGNAGAAAPGRFCVDICADGDVLVGRLRNAGPVVPGRFCADGGIFKDGDIRGAIFCANGDLCAVSNMVFRLCDLWNDPWVVSCVSGSKEPSAVLSAVGFSSVGEESPCCSKMVARLLQQAE